MNPYESFLKYGRNTYNKYLFGHTTRNTKHPFKLPTNFTAPIPDNSNLQEYISNAYYDIKTNYQITTNPPRSNITKQKIQSLHQLKPADKGGAIVIWPKDSYLKEAYRQLNDSNHYQKNPTPDILEDIEKLQQFLTYINNFHPIKQQLNLIVHTHIKLLIFWIQRSTLTQTTNLNQTCISNLQTEHYYCTITLSFPNHAKTR